jgi:hypothetical protein
MDDVHRAARSLESLALEQRRRQGPGHPAAEKLVAYQERRLAPGERDEIQGHLAVCWECTQELLELARLDEAFEEDDPEAAEDENVSALAETEASWQALRARLPASPVQGRVLGAPSRFRRWTTAPWTAPALAAALIACLIGFPLWMSLHRAPVAASPVKVNKPGTAEILRGADDARVLVSLSLGEAAVLSLPVPARPAFPAYRIDILSPRGQLRLAVKPAIVPMAARQGVQRSSEGEEPGRFVSFGLPRKALAPGLYRLRVVGLASGREGETLAEHRIRVVNP